MEQKEKAPSGQFTKKICVLGDFAVGKTSLVRRFVYDLFQDKYLTTIGVKVSRKVVAVTRSGQVTDLTLMLWDLASQEEFNAIRASYMRGAAGAILVCDLTRAETLHNLQRYAADLRSVVPAAHIVLAANKCDLAEQQLAPQQVDAVAASLQAPCYSTSAKTGEAVEQVFRHLGRLLVT